MSKEAVIKTAYKITEAIATGGFSLITESSRPIHHPESRAMPQTRTGTIVEVIRTGGFCLIIERKEP